MININCSHEKYLAQYIGALVLATLILILQQPSGCDSCCCRVNLNIQFSATHSFTGVLSVNTNGVEGVGQMTRPMVGHVPSPASLFLTPPSPNSPSCKTFNTCRHQHCCQHAENSGGGQLIVLDYLTRVLSGLEVI